jgi:site-specific DNA-methyltransferase (adenine-specific)
LQITIGAILELSSKTPQPTSTGIGIKDAAQLLGVSDATIRNWIKSKLLNYLPNKTICPKSLNLFKTQHAGVTKLHSRANKSCKDRNVHTKIAKQVLQQLNAPHTDLAKLGAYYEAGMSDSHRNLEGIYYTPMNLVHDMLATHCQRDVSNLTFCDPCCGSGNFIVEALQQGFKPEHIYGFDTDPIAVHITKHRIKELTGYDSNQILCVDFLHHCMHDLPTTYDYIFTNPPWGKKISKQKKQTIGSFFGLTQTTDTCALFFMAGLHAIKPSGFMGYLLPEAFFNVSTFAEVRQKILCYQIYRLVDYDKAFVGLLTRAQAIILCKQEPLHTPILCQYQDNKFYRAPDSFKQNPKTILNLHTNSAQVQTIAHLFNLPHVTLKNNATWGIGIVTGNNQMFCKKNPTVDHIPVWKGSDIHANGIKPPSNYIPQDFSLYQQVAPIGLYHASEKLIYKFISKRLCFYCDKEQRTLLNSANMLVLHAGFPLTGEQTAALLNSDLINWYFSQMFHTHKILQSDLITIPLHHEYYHHHTTFNEELYLQYLGVQKSDDGYTCK